MADALVERWGPPRGQDEDTTEIPFYLPAWRQANVKRDPAIIRVIGIKSEDDRQPPARSESRDNETRELVLSISSFLVAIVITSVLLQTGSNLAFAGFLLLGTLIAIGLYWRGR